MKSICWIIGVVVILTGCNSQPIQKPENLIDEDKMTSILYDLTVLNAMKSQNPLDSVIQAMKPKDFIYQKYKIDSLQFVLSNQYYISDIETYKKMYEEVDERLQKEKNAAESLLKQGGNSNPATPIMDDAPQIQ